MVSLGIGWAEGGEVERLKGEIMKRLVSLLEPVHRDEKVYIDKDCGRIDFPVEMVGRKVDNSSNADIILTCDPNHLPIDPKSTVGSQKIVITLSYRAYIRHKNVAAAAFFWQKGRPNIIINARYIQKRHIQIPKDYRSFVE